MNDKLKIFLFSIAVFGVISLFYFLPQSRLERLQKEYDKIDEEYSDLEFKYREQQSAFEKVYDEFLYSYFYILGDDDISQSRAEESAIFVHDFLNLYQND